MDDGASVLKIPFGSNRVWVRVPPPAPTWLGRMDSRTARPCQSCASCDVSRGCSVGDLFNRGPADGSWLVPKPPTIHQGGAPAEHAQSSTNLPLESSPVGPASTRGALDGRGGRH